MPLPSVELDTTADTPLYRQVGDVLAGAIADGTLAEANACPPSATSP
jgi:DNA-binding transcriptional regulator YhcF (GntR family)